MPALAADGHRISTNHGIARFLEEHHPEPPLFPADPALRAAVEDAERWANETLQMAARRIPGSALVRDPAAYARSTGDGRLGYLLYTRTLARRLIIPRILRDVFTPPARGRSASSWPSSRRCSTASTPGSGDGVLGGAPLNAADVMVAPSLALILYRPDVMPMFEGRPALALVDRLLPAP